MRKTLNIDKELLEKAREASGAQTDTDAVRLGLEALVRKAAYARLAALEGSEPDFEEAPRRREAPAPSKASSRRRNSEAA